MSFLRDNERAEREKNATSAAIGLIAVLAACTSSNAAAAVGQSQVSPSSAPEAVKESDIVVTAKRVGKSVQIDRTVYDVRVGDDGSSLNTVDVLRNVPGIVVGAANRIIVRGGSDVGYLMDGKPVRREVALAIPASQIDRVELLTNPSSEYDSNGGVLINLVLKKTAVAGWGGAVSGKADTTGGHRTGLDVSHGGRRWTLNGSLSLRSEPGETHAFRTAATGVSAADRTTLVDDVRERSEFRQRTFQVRGTDRISKTKSLTITGGVNVNSDPHHDNGLETVSDADGTRTIDYRRVVSFEGAYPYATVAYEDKKDNDHALTASLDAYGGFSRDRRQTSGFFGGAASDRLAYDFVEGSVEYQRNLGASTSATAGVTISTNDVTDRTALSGFGFAGRNGRSYFRFDRTTYVAYGFLEGSVLGANLKVGLRGETIRQSLRSADGRVPGADLGSRLLPSVHVLRKIGSRNTLTASFTLRTEKPDALFYNPFRRYVSAFQLEQGNPFLGLPVKRQAEMSHSYERAGLSLTQTFYYRDEKNGVNPYTFAGGDGITVYSYANLSSERTFGYSLTIKKNVTRDVQIGYDVDLHRQRLAASSALDAFDSIEYTAVDTNVVLDAKVDKSNTLSATAGYADRTFTLGFRNPAIWTTAVHYAHAFPDKVSLTADLVDFATPQLVTTRFGGPGIDGFERVRRNSRLFRIGLSKAF